MRYSLTLLRHGESEANASGTLQGQTDSPLSEAGREQARHLARHWREVGVHFDRITASPLARARETAEIIASILKAPVDIDNLWTERNFGELEGHTFDEIRQAEPPVDFHEPFIPVGKSGESQVDLYVRACLGLQSLIRRPPGNYLVVSHGSILTRVIYAVLGITPQGHYYRVQFNLGNTTYVNLIYESDRHRWMFNAFTPLDEWQGMGSEQG